MALFFDTDVDEAADDALQVVDLDDILMDGYDESSPDEIGKGPRAPRRRVTRLAVAGAIVLVVAVGGVATLRYLQSDRDSSQIDIDDRDRELPDLPPPTSEPQPPQQSAETTAPPTTGTTTAPVAETDPGGKAAFKAGLAAQPPASQPPGPAPTAPPATTPSTVPPTTATTIDTTSVTLPDGSPNPYGPGPNGPSTGPTTTAPDPWGPDIIPGS